MAHIKISKENLLHNIKTVSKRCGINKFAAVLKDNAYGHGLLECAQICKSAGVRYAIVRENSEADVIHDLFEMVLVLSDAATPKHPNVHITINSIEDIKKLSSGTNVHLKIDTGMHRNGVRTDELTSALGAIVKGGLNLKGIMTHLKGADELSSEYFWQEKIFLSCVETVETFCTSNNIQKPMVHMHNSAGTYRKNDFELFDMVRVGIAMYGYMDLPNGFDKIELRPVMSLHADRISSRTVRANETIGYGGNGRVAQETTIGVYDVGYADGFFRLNESKSLTLPDGSRTIGKVSMDSVIINSQKEQICLFDDARELARINDTITYDVLVKLSPKIARIVS